MYTESIQLEFPIQLLVEIRLLYLLHEPQKLPTSLSADLVQKVLQLFFPLSHEFFVLVPKELLWRK